MKSRLNSFAQWLVRALTIAFWAALAILGGLRLWQSLELKPWLIDVGVKPGPLYLTLSGAAQALLAIVALAVFCSKKAWKKWLVFGLALIWMLGFWIDRIWIAVSPAARVNDGFVAVFLAFWLLILWTATFQQN